jgi:TonB family protein
MNFRAALLCVLLICAAVLLVAPLYGQGHASWHLSSGLDAHGVRHYGDQYPGRGPWMDDVIHTASLDYPASERASRHQGSGVVRLTLDLKTGSVSKVTILRSTGFPVLDRSAQTSFGQWRWKPGRWKEVDVPVTFTIGAQSGLYMGRNKIR